jgi:hypothetical protein
VRKAKNLVLMRMRIFAARHHFIVKQFIRNYEAHKGFFPIIIIIWLFIIPVPSIENFKWETPTLGHQPTSYSSIYAISRLQNTTPLTFCSPTIGQTHNQRRFGSKKLPEVDEDGLPIDYKTREFVLGSRRLDQFLAASTGKPRKLYSLNKH